MSLQIFSPLFLLGDLSFLIALYTFCIYSDMKDRHHFDMPSRQRENQSATFLVVLICASCAGEERDLV